MTSFAPLESIRFCILFALINEPLHGADIEGQIMEDSRNAAHIQLATIYKTLTSLEQAGYIELTEAGVSVGNPKYYQLTEPGKHILKREIQRYKDTVSLAHKRGF